ncbi:macrophage mannose receptor 1-like isoform X2 [Clavelina lepadiformis]|uniref:C-type lectin domain-containing protein n=1 Tax=Clavelina lepadiformis TaxID=159417 RepID=A0ABP0GDI1_CLALP
MNNMDKLTIFSLMITCAYAQSWHQLDRMEYLIENNETYDFERASDICSSKGGILAVVNTRNIQDFLEKKIERISAAQEISFYIGMRRKASGTAFQWVDGEELANDFTNWFKGRPRAPQFGGNCVIMGHIALLQSYFHWWDVTCTQRAGYVCQRMIASEELTTIPVPTTLQQTNAEVSLSNRWHKDHGFEYYFEAGNEHNFKSASATCATMNASLVVIDEQVQQYVASVLTNLTENQAVRFYIGMKRETFNDSETFLWVNGDPVSMGYTNWFRNQPDLSSNGRNCALLVSFATAKNNYQWWTVNCSRDNGFICQRPVKATPMHPTETVVWHNYANIEYYIQRDQEYDFDNAAKNCSSRGGSLAVINSQEIQTFLENTVGYIPNDKSAIFYIGLTREKDNPKFHWSDGAPLLPADYSNWFTGQPAPLSRKEFCTTIGHFGVIASYFHWWDVKCDSKGGYVCQREATVTSPVTTTTQEPTTTTISEEDRDIWLQHGDYEYFIENEDTTNFANAVSICKSKNASLVIINSPSIQRFLVTNINVNNVDRFAYYIGLTRVDKDESTFEWVNGTLSSDGYTNWFSSQPDESRSGENCVIMGYSYNLQSNFHWWDIQCDSPNHFICQRKTPESVPSDIFPISTNGLWYQSGSLEYFIEREEAYDYDSALRACATRNASLAIVDTRDIHDFIVRNVGIFPGDEMFTTYIGLKRKSVRDFTFEWLDGTPLSETYTNWFKNHPRPYTTGYNCVVIGHAPQLRSVYHWWSVDCSTRSGYVCQRETVEEVPRDLTISDELWERNDEFEYFVEQNKTYTYATSARICAANDARLVVIDDETVQAFLESYIGPLSPSRSHLFYIGMKRETSGNDEFEWVNGNLVSENYTNWFSQPSDGTSGEDCAALVHFAQLKSNFHWWDLACSTKGGYICQRKVKIETTTVVVPTLAPSIWRKKGNLEYFIQRNPTYDYDSASQTCVGNGGMLAVVNSKEIQEFLASNIGSGTASEGLQLFIGYIRENSGRFNFIWENETHASSNYTNWFTGQPSEIGSDENCVVMGYVDSLHSHFHWWDLSCSSFAGFICQRKVQAEAITVPPPIADNRQWKLYGNFEYFIELEDHYEYQSSKQICEDNRATLAIIMTKEVQEFLSSTFGSIPDNETHFLYIGLTRENSENLLFEWADGSALSPSGYNNWFSNQPSKAISRKNCVVLGYNFAVRSNFHWWNLKCSTPGGFICQRESSGPGRFASASGTLSTTNIIIICAALVAGIVVLVLTISLYSRRKKLRRMRQGSEEDLNLQYIYPKGNSDHPPQYDDINKHRPPHKDSLTDLSGSVASNKEVRKNGDVEEDDAADISSSNDGDPEEIRNSPSSLSIRSQASETTTSET